VCGVDPAARLDRHRHTYIHTKTDRQTDIHTDQDAHTHTVIIIIISINKLVKSVVCQLVKDPRCTTISVQINNSCLSPVDWKLMIRQCGKCSIKSFLSISRKQTV